MNKDEIIYQQINNLTIPIDRNNALAMQCIEDANSNIYFNLTTTQCGKSIQIELNKMQVAKLIEFIETNLQFK